jgi:hypothetical protein
MKRRTCLGVLGGVIATAGCTGGGGESRSKTTSTSTTKEPTSHDLGEPFTVGTGAKSIQYRVRDAFSVDTAVGSSMVSIEPDGVFIAVILELENVGQESLDIGTRHLKLLDADGRTFEADTEALSYAVNDERLAEPLTFDQLQPGLAVTRTILFDVPAGSAYGLVVDPVGIFSSADDHFVPLGRV